MLPPHSITTFDAVNELEPSITTVLLYMLISEVALPVPLKIPTITLVAVAVPL